VITTRDATAAQRYSVDLRTLKNLHMTSLVSSRSLAVSNLKVCVSEVVLGFRIAKVMVRCGTQFGTQKGAERAVEAVGAVHAVRNFLRKFSAC